MTTNTHGTDPAAEPVWVVVALSGDLDLAATRALDVLGAAVADHPGARILVDLSDVTFLDSRAIEAFETARARSVATGGSLTLHGASSFASRLLQIWHLEPILRDVGHPDHVA